MNSQFSPGKCFLTVEVCVKILGNLCSPLIDQYNLFLYAVHNTSLKEWVLGLHFGVFSFHTAQRTPSSRSMTVASRIYLKRYM